MSSVEENVGRQPLGREQAMQGEFTAEVGEDGRIALPAELLARLRLHGVRALRVSVAPAGAERALLAARGVSDAAVNRVAEVQRVPAVVAESMLLAEGAALNYPELAARLRAISLPFPKP